MSKLTPQKLHLLGYYEDGEDSRHFCFRIERPRVSDLTVIPGQFFMLALPGYGEAPFSYVSLPDQNGRFSALIHRSGTLTGALFALGVGAVLGYRGPFGKGWPLFFSAHRVLAVASGCGLAPLAGVLDEATSQRLPLQLSVLYGARNSSSQVLGRERARWKLQMRFIETFEEALAGQRQGTPLECFDELFALARPDTVLCCGPEPLILATAEACLERGIPPNRIWLALERRMLCGDGQGGHGDAAASQDGPIYRYDRYQKLLASSTGQSVEQHYRFR